MVETQLTVHEERWKSEDMVGSAMLTIVPSSADMNAAREMERIRRLKPAGLIP